MITAGLVVIRGSAACNIHNTCSSVVPVPPHRLAKTFVSDMNMAVLCAVVILQQGSVAVAPLVLVC